MFIVIVSAILGTVVAVALVSIKFLFSERLAKKFYKIFALADLAVIAVIIGGWWIRGLVPDFFIAVFGNCATIFLMAQLICGALVIVAVAARWIYRKLAKPKPFDPARRRALAHAMLYPLFSAAIALYGNRVEKNSDVENFYDVPIKNLPPDLDGFRLAQISDIHLGAYYSLERLEALLQRIADAKPDMLAITGDIFDDVTMNPAAVKIVDAFTDKFKFGVWYIHGNHEHFRGIRAIENLLAHTKIHWLVNRAEHVTSKLYVLGVDYPPRAPVTSSNDAEHVKLFAQARKNFVDLAAEGVHSTV